MNVNELVLGIDIGGTNVVLGFCDKIGNIHFETSLSTSSFKSPSELVETIHQYSCDFNLQESIIGIGIGAPNGNYLTGTVDYAPNLPWKGKIDLVNLFETKFKRRALLTNDANAAALGEKIHGCAKQYNNFVSITLGTGLGSGVISDGNLVYGSNGLAGEYGHIKVIRNGRLCGCGRSGCLETYASSTGVVRSIEELESENKLTSQLLKIESPSAKDVFDCASNGDLFAIEIIEFTSNVLGEALADFACFSDPEAFILFGGIAQSGDDFSQAVKTSMEKHILSIYKNKIDIKISELHDKNAAILGASSLVWMNLK